MKFLNSKFYVLNSDRRGFTLVELLISVAILAIMGAMGAVSLSGFRRDRQLELAASDITYTLRRAQSAAIAQENSSAWGVHFDNPSSGADSFSLFYGNSYATGTILSMNRLSSFLDYSDPSTGSTKDVLFAKATGLPGASTTIVIIRAGVASSSRTVTVNAIGKASY